MSAAIGQGESAQQRFHAENIAKLGHNWNATAFAYKSDVIGKRLP